MKTLQMILPGGVLIVLSFLSSAQAQVYGARRYVNPRLAHQAPGQATRPMVVATNTPPLATNAPAVPPAPSATARHSPTQAVVRIIQPPVDPEKARAAKAEALRKTVEFQKKKAEEGSESAQYELGLRYLKGDGVEKDEATGRKWLAESAKNGYGPATKKLEDLDLPPKVKEE